MIAALFVEKDGAYWNLPDVDPWDLKRDARLYAGPWPVVAHPPCERWCKLAPVNQARYDLAVGADEGCFASALGSVRKWSGVLEHPADSFAWRAHGLIEPDRSGGWIPADWLSGHDGWTCCVEQRHWGHRARKATWLYACGVALPSLKWGKGKAPEAWISTNQPRAKLAALGIAQLGKKEARATPPMFRDLLISIAETASGKAAT